MEQTNWKLIQWPLDRHLLSTHQISSLTYHPNLNQSNRSWDKAMKAMMKMRYLCTLLYQIKLKKLRHRSRSFRHTIEGLLMQLISWISRDQRMLVNKVLFSNSNLKYWTVKQFLCHQAFRKIQTVLRSSVYQTSKVEVQDDSKIKNQVLSQIRVTHLLPAMKGRAIAKAQNLFRWTHLENEIQSWIQSRVSSRRCIYSTIMRAKIAAIIIIHINLRLVRILSCSLNKITELDLHARLIIRTSYEKLRSKSTSKKWANHQSQGPKSESMLHSPEQQK